MADIYQNDECNLISKRPQTIKPKIKNQSFVINNGKAVTEINHKLHPHTVFFI